MYTLITYWSVAGQEDGLRTIPWKLVTEMQNLRLIPDMLNQSLHFIKVPMEFIRMFMVWSRVLPSETGHR